MKKIVALIISSSLLLADVYINHKNFYIQKPIKSWVEFKNDNLVRQKYDYSCGSASLSTIMSYFYDQNMSEKSILSDILEMKGIDSSRAKELEKEDLSLSFLELSEYVKSKGFKAVGLALDLKALKSLKIPVILFVKIRKSEHFTVFKGIDDRYVYLADPSLGNNKIRISKFREMFYQRDDLKHPGKLLAILPIDRNMTWNKEFMKIRNSSNLIYSIIDTKMIQKKDNE